MKTTTLALAVAGLAATSQATVIRAFEDTTLAPGYNYSTTSAKLVVDPTFGAGQVAKITFNLNGQYSGAGIAFGFKDWGAYDFKALTSISVYLKADTTRTVAFTFKMGTKSLYDTLGNGGKVFTATAVASKTGGIVTIPKAKFDFPDWTIARGRINDSLANVWLGIDSTDYLKHLDTVLADLKFVQLAVPCAKKYDGKDQNCLNDSGFLEIDSLSLNGVTIGGSDWSDPHNAAGIGARTGFASRSFGAIVRGQVMDVSLPTAVSDAKIVLVRQDGSKVAGWTTTSASSSLALPVGLEKGKYFVVCDLPSGRSVGSIAIIR